MHQNSPFELKNGKIFWGGGTAPVEGDTPSPHPTPLSAFGASILGPSALDLGLRDDCHGSYGLLATPLLQRSTIIRLGPRPPTS